MKKRLYRWRFFLAVVVVILARSGHLDLSKEIQNICTGNRGFTERSLWNTYIAAVGGMEL